MGYVHGSVIAHPGGHRHVSGLESAVGVECCAVHRDGLFVAELQAREVLAGAGDEGGVAGGGVGVAADRYGGVALIVEHPEVAGDLGVFVGLAVDGRGRDHGIVDLPIAVELVFGRLQLGGKVRRGGGGVGVAHVGLARKVVELVLHLVDLYLLPRDQFVEVPAVVVVLAEVILGVNRHPGVVSEIVVAAVEPVLLFRCELVPQVVELLGVLRQWLRQGGPDVGAVLSGPGGVVAYRGDGACQVGVGGVGLGEDLADAVDEVLFLEKVRGVILGPFVIEGGDGARDGIDAEAFAAGVAVDGLQFVFNGLNFVSRLARRRGDGCHLVGVSRQVTAQLLQSGAGSVATGALPGGDHRQLRQAGLHLVGTGSSLAQRSGYVLDCGGVPAVDVGESDRHQSWRSSASAACESFWA
ncbi:hypothetical protein OS122_28615 [Mycolicibacterium mucogenicum]|nr:hypothetical protein [Mycolicibacterium mucogenicum]MCX8564850.1 hypothetical protein [Mycolicibacterium mucogenicum]